MPAPYSAGSIFLQVVPSFRGVPEQIAREARERWADAASKGFDESMEKRAQETGRKMGQQITSELGKAGKKAGKDAGDAYAGSFRDSLRNGIRSAQHELNGLKVRVDDRDLQHQIGLIKNGLKGLDRNVKLGADSGQVFITLQRLLQKVEDIQDKAGNLEVRASLGEVHRGLDGVAAHIRKVSAMNIEPDLKLDRQLGSFERGLRRAVENATREIGTRNTGPGSNAGERALAELRRQLLELSDMQVGIDISDETARARVEHIRDQLQQLQREHWSVALDADTSAALAHLAAFSTALEAIDGRHVDVEVDVKDAVSAASHLHNLERSGLLAGRSMENLSRSTRHASSSGQDGANSFRAFNARVLGIAALGPLAVPALGAIAAGIGALGPLAAAAGAGIGVLVLGLLGLGSAFKALGAARDSASKDLEAYRDRVTSASRGVADAERAVARAREDAARSSEDAAMQVASALRGVEDAERNLRSAQRDAKQAQEELTQARAEAAEQLEDLQLRARDGALDQRQAVLDLHDAEKELNEARANGVSGDALEQLIINYDRAKLRIDQTKESNEDLAAEQAKWAKDGVEGSDVVVAAQERVRASQEAVADAQRGVIDAERDVARAREQQSRAAVDGQRAVADAQRNLTRAQADFSDAVSETSTSQQKLNQEMAKLGPAGREFVTWLDGLRPRLQRLRNLAQAGFLPGLQNWLDALINNPYIDRGIARISGALGHMFDAFAESIRGPAFSQLFEMINRSGPRFIGYMSDILVNLGEGIAYLITAMEPLGDLFGGWFVDITRAFRDWAQGLRGSQGLQEFFDWIRRVGPKIARFFFELGDALVAIGIAIAPFAEGLLEVLTDILDWISELDPATLRNLTLLILGLTVALQAIFGLTALANSFRTAMHTLSAVLEGFKPGTLLAVAPWLVLAGAIFLLWQNSEGFRDALKTLWHEVLEPLFQLLGEVAGAVLEPLFHLIGDNIEIVAGIAAAWASWKIILQVVGWIKTLRTALSELAIVQAVTNSTSGGLMTGPGDARRGVGARGGRLAGLGAFLGASAPTLLGGLALAGVGVASSLASNVTDQNRGAFDQLFASIRQGGPNAEGSEKIVAGLRRQLANESGLDRFGRGLRDVFLPGQDTLSTFEQADKAARDQFAALSPLEQAQAKVAEWTERLADRQHRLGETSDETAAAHRRLDYWTQQVEIHQRQTADAASGLNTELLEQQGLSIALADADIAYAQAKDALDTAFQNYKDTLSDVNATDEERRAAEEAWVNQSRQTAEAAKRLAQARHLNADAATQEAFGNAALLLDLERQKEQYGELPPRLEQLRQELENSVDPAVLLAEKTEELGLSIARVPDSKSIVIDSTTPEQIEQLEALGFEVTELPNGQFQVTAKTDEAEAALDYLTRDRTVTIETEVIDNDSGFYQKRYVDKEAGTAHLGPRFNAAGGYIQGPGGPTDDSILSWLSNGEFVVKASSVAKYGVPLLEAINAGKFAGGGLVRKTKKGLPAYEGGGMVARWGGTISLSPGDVAPLARMWYTALEQIGRLSAAAANAISGVFRVMRDNVAAIFGETRTLAGQQIAAMAKELVTSAGLARDGVTLRLGQMRDTSVRTIADAVLRMSTTWAGLPKGLLKSVNTIIDKVLNNGLFKAFNSIVSSLGLDPKMQIPSAEVVKLAAGGRVPGWSPHDKADNIPAMLTAGEYVQPVDVVRHYGVDFMERLRRKELPRFAEGGYVAMTNVIKRAFPWARITSAYRPGDPGYHGQGKAIDIGGARPYPDPEAIQQMLLINRWIAANFRDITELIHSGPGAINLWHGQPHLYDAATRAEHLNHVHWAMANGLIPGSSGIGSGDLTGILLGDPAAFLRDTVEKALDGFDTRGGVQKIMAAGARKVVDWVAEKVTGFVGNIFGSADDASFVGGGSGPVRAQVQAIAAQAGWGTGPQWAALDWLIQHESSWNPNAQNPSSTAFGLFQFLNSTWAGTGVAKTSDPTQQAIAGIKYIKSRYGDPLRAKAFWLQNHYYGDGGPVQDVDPMSGGVIPDLHDNGGWLMPGLNVIMNRTGRPEPTINPDTLEALQQIAAGGGGPVIGSYNQTVVADSPKEAFEQLMHDVRVVKAVGGRYSGLDD